MAKKKTTRKAAKKATPAKKSAAKAKRPAKKAAPRKRAAAKSVKKVAKKKPSKATSTKSPAKKSPARKKSATPAKSTSRSRKKATKQSKLGRPRIPGDAKIDSVFRKEFDARQLCEFLGVDTVRELEKFAPEEIIQKMMAPIVQTVGKIRKILAVANRSLATDEDFAIEFRDLYAPPDDVA